jgi:hypothetical protein
MGHRHRLGLGELPVKRSSRQLQPTPLEHTSARKYWLKPPILKLRGFATAFSYAFRSMQWFLAEDELILPAVERLSLQKCFLVETGSVWKVTPIMSATSLTE